MAEPNWALEVFKAVPSLFAALIGGGLALLGGYLVDRRKARAEESVRELRQRTVLTGMFAIRNHIVSALNVWQDTGLTSELDALRTSQSYVHRLIDKAPIDSESLMIAVVEVGVHLDTLLLTVDASNKKPPTSKDLVFATRVTRHANALLASLEQYDMLAASELSMVTTDDMARWGYIDAEDLAEIELERDSAKPHPKRK